MSEKTREHISSLMDGEISRETSRFLVRRLGSDEELCATWARYHLVRDCLRHQDGSLSGEDLCSRVNRALEDEQPSTPVRRLSLGWLKPVAGTAIAASVALAAVMAVGPGGPGGQQLPAGNAPGGELSSFTSPQGLVSGQAAQPVSALGAQTNAGRKMNFYLLRHYQASGTGNGGGFVAYMPAVAKSTRTARDDKQEMTDDESKELNTP